MKPRTTRTATIAAALVVAAGVGAGGGAATYAALSDDGTRTVIRPAAAAETATPAASTSESMSVSDIYENTYKSVVEITSIAGQAAPFGGEGQEQAQGQGSGFVYDAEGHIVTNQHVVDGADRVTVRFWDGSTYDASVVGSDPSTDLAVVKVDAPANVLQPLSLGASDDLTVGEPVVALGSPFGLEGTVTSGIVSALHRQMTAPNNFTINDSIQTDAAINHGNSGGPLVNGAGEVVGVNAQIESESGGSDGIGFAIPSKTIESIVPQIIADGSVEHAYLGVGVAELNQSQPDQHHRHPGPRPLHRRGGALAARTRRRRCGLRGQGGRRAPVRDRRAPGRQVRRPARLLRQQDGQARCRLLLHRGDHQGPPRC
jgi:putative serine protease PepD